MLIAGDLIYKYPEMISHPHQAYKTKKVVQLKENDHSKNKNLVQYPSFKIARLASMNTGEPCTKLKAAFLK